MFKKKYFIAFTLTLLVLMIGGCKSQTSSTPEPAKKAPEVVAPKTDTVKNTVKPVVTIEMEDGTKIKIELDPLVAPNTVNNFVSLANKGFYNGLIFHRVVPGFMIQGGDPKGTGGGDPGYSIKGEFSENGVKTNTLKHARGIISMARAQDNNSGGSQFFIMAKDSNFLDGKYAAFGKVLEGMEEVDKIVSTPSDNSEQGGNGGRPIKEQKMKTVTVDTLGGKFSEPEKVK